MKVNGNTRSIPRPFLKWAGGKSKVLKNLQQTMPKEFNRFFEPFCGGGALFFGLKPNEAYLSDNNRELIDCYSAVRDHLEELIESLGQYQYDKDMYYEVRARDPWSMSIVERSARMIYLNRTGFNGLYRVNKSGGFNVPFGRYTNPTICDQENLTACSKLLKTVDLKAVPFENVLQRAESGDFVYFDPPYIPLSDTASFTAYQSGGFGMSSQQKLLDVYTELSKKGVKCLLSNSDVPWMRENYRAFNIESIKVARMINSRADRRGAVGEVLVSNY